MVNSLTRICKQLDQIECNGYTTLDGWMDGYLSTTYLEEYHGFSKLQSPNTNAKIFFDRCTSIIKDYHTRKNKKKKDRIHF